jgi:hypothetical protein
MAKRLTLNSEKSSGHSSGKNDHRSYSRNKWKCISFPENQNLLKLKLGRNFMEGIMV